MLEILTKEFEVLKKKVVISGLYLIRFVSPSCSLPNCNIFWVS